MDDLPYESLLGLENVRKLEITYNRHPWEGVCVVEYVGGRIELSEMDRYLIEQLLVHLEHGEG